MKENSTLEQFIKNTLGKEEHSFDNALWNKLNQQLIPIRAEHHKKEKRRILWLLLPVSMLLVSGVAYWVMCGGGKVEKVVVSNGSNISSNSEQNVKPNTTNPTNNGEAIVLNSDKQTSDITSVDRNSSLSITKSNSKNEVVVNNNDGSKVIAPTKKVATNKMGKQSLPSIVNNKVANSQNIPIAVPTIDNNSTATEVSGEKEEQGVTKVFEDVKADNTKLPIVLTPEKELTKSKTSTDKQYKSLPFEYYALGGVNFSSPFKKGGYFGGIQVEKQINDKRLFFGLKVAYNNLNHQLVASKNATVFPQTTDAMINRMTTIQVPFGYQFKLSKALASKATLLNVGFEPTLITGVQTIYYDDNGVPGGPRTAVVNSPLLSNAINRFNLSFIAGIKKQLTNKIGFNLNAGYGLIDITDKQYYNKTSSNNNLKYIQLGLHYKLR